MTQHRQQSEHRLYEEVSRLWNRHVTVAAITEGDERSDTLTRLILKSIALNGPVRSSDAARDTGLSRAAISRRITALEANGFVSADTDPADRRASLLTLTAEGQRHLHELSLSGAATIREVTNDFSDEDLERFAELLGRFNTNAAERLTATVRSEHA